MEFIQALILGIVQGLSEWLPVSSQGMTSLVMVNFFNRTLADAITYALWLHVGTLAAAILYFWSDVKSLWRSLPTLVMKKADAHTSLLRFLAVTTIVSLVLGGILYFFVLDKLQVTGVLANAIIGVFLLITGVVQVAKRAPTKEKKSLPLVDALITGVGQALAAFPGISRSGTTTAILLFRKFSAKEALRLSFLMSIPLTFVAMLVLLFENGAFFFSFSSLAALLMSFLVGILTIKYFMKLAEKISFGYFALFFAIVLLVSSALSFFI